jgi:hypothetical protein
VSGLRQAVEALAMDWASQPNDYDEDTEQQISDGKNLLALLAAHPETDDGVSPASSPASTPSSPTLNRDAVAGLLVGESPRADGLGASITADRALELADAIASMFRPEHEVKAEALDEVADHLCTKPWAGSVIAAYIQGRATRLRSGAES